MKGKPPMFPRSLAFLSLALMLVATACTSLADKASEQTDDAFGPAPMSAELAATLETFGNPMPKW